MNLRLQKQLQEEINKLAHEKLYHGQLLNDNTALLSIYTSEETVRFLAFYPPDYPFKGPIVYTTNPKMLTHSDFSTGRMAFTRWQPAARTLEILLDLHTMYTELD